MRERLCENAVIWDGGFPNPHRESIPGYAAIENKAG